MTALAPRRLARAVVGKWRVWLGVVISLAFLYWVGRQVQDFDKVGQALSAADYWYAIPALAAYFFGVWLRAARWRFLLRPLKLLSPNRLFPIVVIGYMANDVLPARLGEVVRAYVIGERENLSKAAVLGTVAVERTFDGLTMLIFMAVVALIVPLDETLVNILRFASIVFILAVLAFAALAAKPDLARSVIRRLVTPLPRRFGEIADTIFARFVGGLAVMQRPLDVIAVLGLSIGAWLAEALMYLLVAQGFGLGLGYEAFVLTTAVANIGGMIPSSPGYVGTFEWFSLAALSLFGIPGARALSYTLVLHALLLVPVTLLGFYYLWRYGLSIRSIQSGQIAGRAED